MQVYPLMQFYKKKYSVSYLNCLRQFWRTEREFSCIGFPKEQELFLYLDGCKARYRFDGKEFIAQSGDLVYTPSGAEYQVEFFDFEHERAGTVGVNFLLFDEDGTACSFAHSPTLFQGIPALGVLCLHIERLSYSFTQIPAKYTALLYELITELGETQMGINENESAFSLLRSGVEYLTEHLHENTPIPMLAEKCGISEAYFRRLFHKCFGFSPVEYKEELRIERTYRYLRYSQASIREISDILGYDEPAYFIKRFKKKTGVTPLQFRKNSK